MTASNACLHGSGEWQKVSGPLQDKSKLTLCMWALQGKEQDDEDLEAILAELDGKPAPTQPPAVINPAVAAAPTEQASAEQPADEEENTAVSPCPFSSYGSRHSP